MQAPIANAVDLLQSIESVLDELERKPDLVFMNRLIEIGEQIRAGSLPERRAWIGWTPMIMDSWDWQDPLLQRIMAIEKAYTTVERNPEPIPVDATTAGRYGRWKEIARQAQAAFQQVAAAQETALRAENRRLIADLAAKGVRVRPVPHDPAVSSMLMQWECARQAEPTGPAAESDRWMCLALFGWFFGEPVPQVAADLRHAVDYAWEACGQGPTPRLTYLWLFDVLMAALVVRRDDIALNLTRLPAAHWDTPHRCEAIAAQADAVRSLLDGGPWPPAVTRLAEPPDPDGRDWWDIQWPTSARLLQAVRDRNDRAFHEAMKRRLERRTAVFARMNRIAAAGLIDLHALGLCALARRAGLTVRPESPYVPVEILDG